MGVGRRSQPGHAVGDRTDPVLATPTIERRVFLGQDGLRALPIGGRIESRNGSPFGAEIVQAQLGAVMLRRTSISPHRAVVAGHEEGVDDGVLRFVTLQQGSMIVAAPGLKPIRLGAGDALFTYRPRTYLYEAKEPIVVVSSNAPVTSLPAVVRGYEDLPVGPLPRAPLVGAVVDLLLHLADRLDEPWGFDADYAARGLLDLETAILTEVVARDTPIPGPDRVYSAAVDYIERHLAEPELRPPQIAQALGVSLRYLHRAFADKEVTVARLLRERRLERVAESLRTEGGHPPLRSLAVRYGFGSQDQLVRAFRRRYGVAMSDYRAAELDG